MSNIPDLQVIRQTPNKALIAYLESALGKAKEGRLKGIVAAQLWDDDQTTHAWRLPGGNLWNIPRVVGELYVTMNELANVVNKARDSD